MGADTISSLDYIFFLCAQGLPHNRTGGAIRPIIYTHKYLHTHLYKKGKKIYLKHRESALKDELKTIIQL